MQAIAWIIERFNWLADYFYKAYIEINDLPWPFWLAAWPFWMVAETCSQIAWSFLKFYDWIVWANYKIASIMSLEVIFTYILNRIWFIWEKILGTERII